MAYWSSFSAAVAEVPGAVTRGLRWTRCATPSSRSRSAIWWPTTDPGVPARCQHPLVPNAQLVPGAGSVRAPEKKCGAGNGTVSSSAEVSCWRPSCDPIAVRGHGLDRASRAIETEARHDARRSAASWGRPYARRLHAEEGLRTCPDPAFALSRALHSQARWAPLPSHGRPSGPLLECPEQMRSLPDVFAQRCHRPASARVTGAATASSTPAGAGRRRPRMMRHRRGYKAIHESRCSSDLVAGDAAPLSRIAAVSTAPTSDRRIYCLRNAIVKVAPEELECRVMRA